jgi:cytochrome P450
MKDLHGNCFTLFLAGRRMTFVMDPHSFPGVYREKSILEFDSFVLDILENVFLIPTPEIGPSLHTIQKQYSAHLFGTDLELLSKLFLNILTRILEESLIKAPNSIWTTGNLSDFCGRLFFAASVQCLFGTFETQELYEAFVTFDRDFQLLASGLSIGINEARKAHKEGVRILEKGLRDSADGDRSRLISKRIQLFAELGLSETNQFRFHFSSMWGSQSNALPAVFWTMAYIISNPIVYKKVIQEVNEKKSFDGDLETKFPVLNACFSEALRLSSGTYSVRMASEEYQLSIIAEQEDYLMRKGDTVVLALPFTHYDDELYPNSKVFDPNRFLEHKTYEKDGVPVKSPYIPFGGGISLCPGRKFARNEIIMFAATLLSKFEFELVNEAGQGQKDANNLLPPLKLGLLGVGVVGPEHDIPFRYRPL